MVKRGIDIAGAIVGLVLSGPLMLAIAAAIKLTSPGPAFFTQERYGLHKRRFRMYKFRTMVPDADSGRQSWNPSNEAQGPVFKIRNDPRITSIGRMLRRTSLDELPQLLTCSGVKCHWSVPGPSQSGTSHGSRRFVHAALQRETGFDVSLAGERKK